MIEIKKGVGILGLKIEGIKRVALIAGVGFAVSHLAWAQTQAPARPATMPAASPAPARAQAAAPVAAPAASVATPGGAERAGLPDVRVLLEPISFTTLASPIDGRIIEVATGIGRSFDQSSVLVRFDCQEQVAKLAISKTELRASSEKYESKLILKGLDQASEIEVQLAALEVEKNKSQVELFEFQIRQCSVTAPWSGSTAKLHVRSFMSVNRGAPLLDLIRSGPLKARMNLPSRSLGVVKMRSPIKIVVDETGKTYAAKISAINARVDAVSQTIEVEATLDTAPRELLPGMSGIVQF
jgi:membrane fusion protein, multidrug efflux system